jgi:hypothetical protein
MRRREKLLLLVLAPLGLAASCGKAPAPPPTTSLPQDWIPLRIAQRCPGDPSCPDSGDGRLYAATAKRDITPLVEPFVDLNGDGRWDPGEPFTDLNGNGKFDPCWMAGFNSGRQAWGVHDPTWVRCYVLKQNETTLAHCVIDAVGWFREETESVRHDLDPKLGVDLLMMSATHEEETKDTTGGWGPDDTTSGYDEQYMARIRALTVEAVTEAVGRLKPAKLSLGSIAVEDAGGDSTHYMSDHRDPQVMDNVLHLLQLDGADDGKPIVTIINWNIHPTATTGNNRYVTSDMPHFLRETVEQGTGSDVVYVSGSVGGLIGTGDVLTPTDDGRMIDEKQGFAFAEALGRNVGRFALKAFAARTEAPSPRLAFRTSVFDVHVENLLFQAQSFIPIYHKPFFGVDKSLPLTGANTPLTQTEAAYITLGPAAIITCPGELLPELFIGGYDGSHSHGWPLLRDMRTPHPNLALAPQGPYLIDVMGGDRAHRMVFGLTLDFTGYIIPPYDFTVDQVAPYIKEAFGKYYEETNSLGPRSAPEIVGTMTQLVTSAP